MNLDPLRNPKDPLRNTGPRSQESLFRSMSALGAGFDSEQVVGAAMNVVLNALRQKHATSKAAEREFDELIARSKGVLLDQHYDGLGKRRNVFPFAQVIEMPLINLRKSS
jgi:hypothetical protein